ncbi:hypothetical protein ACRAWF_13730 [Streptomyces sp. L7]
MKWLANHHPIGDDHRRLVDDPSGHLHGRAGSSNVLLEGRRQISVCSKWLPGR